MTYCLTLYIEVLDEMKKLGVNMDRLCAIGADGASNLTGWKQGALVPSTQT